MLGVCPSFHPSLTKTVSLNVNLTGSEVTRKHASGHASEGLEVGKIEAP